MFLSAIAIGLFAISASLFADTPDGETPANEGVCDGLIGMTPGLYGLCVGFCEAQDCEATFDPATNEITFDESCRPSSPKLLTNYNRKMLPDDPPMPCLNIAEDECPCWTEEEIQLLAPESAECIDTRVDYPEFHTLIQLEGRYYGWPELEGVDRARSDAGNHNSGNPTCSYFILRQLHPDDTDQFQISRSFEITPAESEICQASLIQTCQSRGLLP